MGTSIQSENGEVLIFSPAKASCECDTAAVEGQLISEQFHRDVAAIPDEIESPRASVLKKEKVALDPIDAIAQKLTDAATVHAQTDEADMAVYYALSYANSSVAIAYYKQSRGVPSEEAQKGQLDSMMCAMESKFALMKGVLLPGGSCSVFERMEAQLLPKPRESPDDE